MDHTHHDHGHHRHEHGAPHHMHHAPHEEKPHLHHAHPSPSGERTAHHGHHAHMVEDFKRRFWISLLITIPIVVLSPMLQHWMGFGHSLRFTLDMQVLFLLSTALFLYGGRPFFTGLRDELKGRRPGMMTLVAVAISTAYVYSSSVVFGLEGETFFWETATLIDIMLLGHWLEMRSVMGASKALEELAALMPSGAHKVMPDGTVSDVPLAELVPGDRILVKPGEKIPADGVVLDGTTTVNESMLTGESKPVSKQMGAAVIGGAINGQGSVTIEVKKTGKDSFLAQVIELVRQAQDSKSRTQDLANRAALWLTIVALGGGAATLFVWKLLLNADLAFALERTVTVMVIACPHALGLAIPLVVAVSTALSARNGLLVRNRAAFEQARNIQAIIFDKTGTLTEGRFGVTDVETSDPAISRDDLLAYAAAVETHSEHPIAKAIVSSARQRLPVDGFKNLPGKGVEGTVNGKIVRVISPRHASGVPVPAGRVGELAAQGKTVVLVVIDDHVRGVVALADVVRPQSRQAIAVLKQMGIRCMMLTGDNAQVAKWVAEETGLDEYFAEVLPHDKAVKVKEVQSRGLVVAMTGDGVNDAPALAQADVGIAIGAGTDVAIEAADIVLVNSNPLDVPAVIGLARATYRKMVQNLAWATGYNVVAIPLAAGAFYGYGILLSPALGAVLMSISTIIVAINARFLRLPQ